MSPINITTSTTGPPPGVNRRGRWAEIHLRVLDAEPGVWVCVTGLDRKDATSLRSALAAKAEQVTTRQQSDGSIEVWALRQSKLDGTEQGEQGPGDAHAVPSPIETTIAGQ